MSSGSHIEGSCRSVNGANSTPSRNREMAVYQMTINTERLVIRSFEETDIPAYAEIVADPRVTRYLGDGRSHSYEEAAAYIRDCIALEVEIGFSRYAVVLEGELIGFCGFKPDGEHIDFGWRYAHRHWGKGYATEAARGVLRYGIEQLGLRRIIAVAYEANVASVRVIEKLGFSFSKRTSNEHGALVWYAHTPGASGEGEKESE